MRIPLSPVDFERGAFTKISKALRKRWPQGELSLMQAQNALAVLFGFHGLHDAQREAATAPATTEGAFSLKKGHDAIAWRLFVRYGIDLLSAKTFSDNLPLKELCVADRSEEAVWRRQVTAMAKQGMLYDEYWDYANAKEPWPEQTPALLARGIPPYTWAIFPDRHVFLWSRLVAQIQMLPAGYVDDLRQQGRLGAGPDAALAFLAESLMPAACLPLADALAVGELDPWGGDPLPWQVRWIVTGQAEVLGCCLVAETLGGVVLTTFQSANDAHHALAGLMCGDAIASESVVGPVISEPLWWLNKRRFELLQRVGPERVFDDLSDYERLPSEITVYRGPDGCGLQARPFTERGQVYGAITVFDPAMQQRLLREEPFFATLDVPADLTATVGAAAGIPALGNPWHDVVEDRVSARVAKVDARFALASGVEALQAAVLATVPVAALDAFVAGQIEELLPLRLPEEVADDAGLVRERREAMDEAVMLGQATMVALPGLAVYSAVALGYMVLQTAGQTLGSRRAWMAHAPDPGQTREQGRLLASLLVYETTGECDIDWTALSCAVAPLLGLALGADVMATYRSGCRVMRHVAQARHALDRVATWRAGEAVVEEQRAAGPFLRVGRLIPTAAPKSSAEVMLDMFAKARSFSPRGTPRLVMQTMDDFTRGGPGL